MTDELEKLKADNAALRNALKMVLDDPNALDGRPRTADVVNEALATDHPGAELLREPDELRAEVERLQAVFCHARGLCVGTDWNHGNAARRHREPLVRAVRAIDPHIPAHTAPEGRTSELEMHRADYEACKDAGFESPGELLAAYAQLQDDYEVKKSAHDNLLTEVERLRGLVAHLEEQIESQYDEAVTTTGNEVERLREGIQDGCR